MSNFKVLLTSLVIVEAKTGGKAAVVGNFYHHFLDE